MPPEAAEAADAVRTPRRIAVVGCGRGSLAIGLARSGAADSVAGFDPDPAAVAQARRAAAAAGVAHRVTFEVSGSLLGDGYDVIFFVGRR